MNAKSMNAQWERLRLLNGIAVRCVESLPENSLDARPIPNMRTPKELIVHLYGQILGAMAEGIGSGEMQAFDETAAAAGIHSRDQLLRFCREQWTRADRAMKDITDAKATSAVKTPWSSDTPGHSMLDALLDEFLHHRGQLYAYLRALGVEPPDNWDFGNNAAEFRPKAHAPSA